MDIRHWNDVCKNDVEFVFKEILVIFQRQLVTWKQRWFNDILTAEKAGLPVSHLFCTQMYFTYKDTYFSGCLCL